MLREWEISGDIRISTVSNISLNIIFTFSNATVMHAL